MAFKLTSVDGLVHLNNEVDPTRAQTLQMNESEEAKILGVAWNTHSDDLSFCVRELVKYTTSFPMTKRSVSQPVFLIPYGCWHPSYNTVKNVVSAAVSKPTTMR